MICIRAMIWCLVIEENNVLKAFCVIYFLAVKYCIYLRVFISSQFYPKCSLWYRTIFLPHYFPWWVPRHSEKRITMIVKSLFVLIISLVIGYVLYKKQLINDNEIEQEIIASWSESIVLPKKQFRKLLVG